MELASVPLSSYYVVSLVLPPAAASRSFSPCLPIFRATVPNISSFSFVSKSKGFLSPHGKVKRSSWAAAHDNAAAAVNKSAQELVSSAEKHILEDDAINKNDKILSDRDMASEQLHDSKMIRICDKLIGVFMVDKPTPTDWRRLLAFSKEWNNIRPHFYKRCQDRANIETDPGMKHKLLRLVRKLKEVDEDIQRHNELLDAIRKSPSEVGEIVARRRKAFTKEFFVHLHIVAESYYDNPTEQNALAKLGNTCIASVQAYDTATESIEALNAAELKFQGIINSPSVDAACKKIDNLAEKNQLDSALVLMITKAWSAAQESNMMKDEIREARDMMNAKVIQKLEELKKIIQDNFIPAPPLPHLYLSEEIAARAAALVRDHANTMLSVAEDIACGRDSRMFVRVALMLLVISTIGSLTDFFTLGYICLVMVLTVPAFYERYEDCIDARALTWYRKLQQLYVRLDEDCINKIHKWFLEKKKLS